MSELLSALDALPRVALLGGGSEYRELWPAAQQLAAGSFATGPRPELRFDVIVAAEPPVQGVALNAWLAAVCGSSRAVLIAVPTSQRGEFSDAVATDRLLARVAAASGLTPHAQPDTELWLIRGELRFPLLRVDDYPTGVRPIPQDLSPIHAVLTAIEERALPYWLGIVPGILTESMFEFLASLRCMVPAQHGYDHAYPRMSARLLRRRDPFNARATVGGFNEFRFQRYATIQRKLRSGQQLLEARLGRAVTTYIPPCNRCDRSTAKALAGLGFKLCLADLPIPGDHLPVLGSDFYGRSNQAQLRPDQEVLCLHTNWEWDLTRAGDRMALPKFLDDVLAQTAKKDRAIERLARYLNDSAGT